LKDKEIDYERTAHFGSRVDGGRSDS